MARPRSVSGIKPTGSPHIGNLLGMILPALRRQETYDCFYFVASYHALTTERDPAALRRQTLEVAATLVAFGLDPERTLLYRQHDIPEVTELYWVFNCLLSMGSLERGHAYKDAVAKGREANVGVFTYPSLMAADILAFDADVVPVGKDQKQHVEMARDIAQRLNHAYQAEILKVPEPAIQDEVATIPGLDGQKMSKSYDNAIEVFLPPKQLRKRVMSIVTDSLPLEAPKDPETCNVFRLYKLFATPDEVAALAGRYRAGGLGYGHAKDELYQVMERTVAGPRERYLELMGAPARLDELLDQHGAKARSIARATTDRVRQAIGL